MSALPYHAMMTIRMKVKMGKCLFFQEKTNTRKAFIARRDAITIPVFPTTVATLALSTLLMSMIAARIFPPASG